LLKLLADENVPRRLVKLLKELSTDALRLQDPGLKVSATMSSLGWPTSSEERY